MRGIVADADGRVLLVEHTYVPGWWLPGGGVDRGETTHEAVVREIREETGFVAEAPPRLLSIHSNERYFPGDHVLVFELPTWRAGETDRPREILAARFFDPDALPSTVNAASARRIAEWRGLAAPDPVW